MKPHLEPELIFCCPGCSAPSFPHYPALWKPSYCSALKEYFSLSPLDISFLLRRSNYHCNLGGGVWGSCCCKTAVLSPLLQTQLAGTTAADERKLINFLDSSREGSLAESTHRARLCPLPPPSTPPSHSALAPRQADPCPALCSSNRRTFPLMLQLWASMTDGTRASSELSLCRVLMEGASC